MPTVPPDLEPNYVARPHPISEYARYLSNASPREYEAFVAAVADLAETLTVAVTEAPTGEVLVAQGRAQSARKILKLLRELPS